MSNVRISADRTCDLGTALEERFGVSTIPYHIILKEKEYLDNVTITAQEIYDVYRAEKVLPKTSAISVGEYEDYFRSLLGEDGEVVHITLGSGLSSSYTNASLAAEELGGRVRIVDSASLSTGTGLLVLKACEWRDEGCDAAEIEKRLKEAVPKAHASFVLDTLEFMAAGGRCSTVAALGANLLKLKPCIAVDNGDAGKMKVTKKYRGALETVLDAYVGDTLAAYEDIDTARIFITHTVIDPKYVETARQAVEKRMRFAEILETDAACTVSSHCGPATLGILFMTK